jgi:hypothetical protein
MGEDTLGYWMYVCIYVMQTSGVGHSCKPGGSASSGLRGMVYQLFIGYDTYIHTYINTYIHTHIHTYTHTYMDNKYIYR